MKWGMVKSTNSFGLSYEDAQDKDAWRLQIKLNWTTQIDLENSC